MQILKRSKGNQLWSQPYHSYPQEDRFLGKPTCKKYVVDSPRPRKQDGQIVATPQVGEEGFQVFLKIQLPFGNHHGEVEKMGPFQ